MQMQQDARNNGTKTRVREDREDAPEKEEESRGNNSISLCVEMNCTSQVTCTSFGRVLIPRRFLLRALHRSPPPTSSSCVRQRTRTELNAVCQTFKMIILYKFCASYLGGQIL